MFRDRYINVSWNVKAGLISYLREVFKDIDDFVYNDDETITKIDITDQTPKKESIEARPAIVIQRGIIRDAPETSTLNDGLRNINTKTGETTYSILTMCDIIIRCCSREGMEADYLASLVRMMIRADPRPLNTLGMKLSNMPIIGMEENLNDVPGAVVVPINFSVTFAQQWRITYHPLNKINSLQANISGWQTLTYPIKE